MLCQHREGRPIPSILIIVSVGLVLVGAYVVRKGILERQIVEALRMNDKARIFSLLNSWPSPVNVRVPKDEDGGDLMLVGQTPLHWAVRGDREEILRLLIAKGADLNARDNFGLTPLHWTTGAATGGYRKAAELLIAGGADGNANK